MEESSFQGLTPGTCFVLLLVPDINLKAVRREIGSSDGKTGLAALLRFVIKGHTESAHKLSEVCVGPEHVSEKATVGNEDTTKGGVISP